MSDRVIAAETIAQQQRDIREQERLFRSLFEHNPDAVVSLDGDGRILEINDAGLAIGAGTYTREQGVGADFRGFLDSAESERVLEYIQRGDAGALVS